MKKPFAISAYGDYRGSVWIIWANNEAEAKKKARQCIEGSHCITVYDILSNNQSNSICIHAWAE